MNPVCGLTQQEGKGQRKLVGDMDFWKSELEPGVIFQGVQIVSGLQVNPFPS